MTKSPEFMYLDKTSSWLESAWQHFKHQGFLCNSIIFLLTVQKFGIRTIRQSIHELMRLFIHFKGIDALIY